ncbi:MAG: CARDB domain-containing protein [Candidatus Promineifilaceae bacterium]
MFEQKIQPGRFSALLALLFALLAIIASAMVDQDALASSLPLDANQSAVPGSCRYGAAALGDDQVDWIDELGAGWFLNFGSGTVSAPNNAEYVYIISVKQEKTDTGEYLPSYTTDPLLTNTGLGSVIDGRPGALWIVGNEVERGPSPGSNVSPQGDVFPEIYAKAYHDIYSFIKNRDPSAQVANSALVQVTPGRLQYLDIMWEAYLAAYGEPMPVDVWNMHVYVLPEANSQGEPNGIANIALGTDPGLAKRESYDPDGGGPLKPKDTCELDEVYCFAEHDSIDLFAEQVVSMRQWMKDHGQQNKPLILSEFSILYPYIQDPGGSCFLQDEYGNCFTYERVRQYLNDSIAFLENTSDPTIGYSLDNQRLVQQWSWFSINNGEQLGAVSNLIAGSPIDLTTIGQAFLANAENEEPTINVFEAQTSNPILFTETLSDTADAVLSTSVYNNGNRTPSTGFTVAFYEDDGLSELIGSSTIQPPGVNRYGLLGCARKELTVIAQWSGLSTGVHRYWVVIDSGNLIDEIDEGDNIQSGIVLVNPYQTQLPLVIK